jgi:hypothetical protein
MKIASLSANISLVPLIVPSSISIPRSRSRTAIASDMSGSGVEQSTTISPLRPVSSNFKELISTSSTTCELGSDSMTTSTSEAIRSGAVAVFAPSFTRASTFAGSTSWTITGNPAVTRCLASELPIRPTPTTAMRFIAFSNCVSDGAPQMNRRR